MEEVQPFLSGMLQFLDTGKSSLMQKLNAEKAISDASRAELMEALKEYKEKFVAERAAA